MNVGIGSVAGNDLAAPSFVRNDLSTEKAAGAPTKREDLPAQAVQQSEADGRPDIGESPLAEILKESKYDINFQLSFSIHKETKELVVKVIDPQTNKVLRQIPPEEILNLAIKLQEMAGLLLDKKV